MKKGVLMEEIECKNTPPDSICSDVKNTRCPYPFVKWAGGKRSLLRDLIQNLPESFNNYYEPFVGGGALFFALFDVIPDTAYLSDINRDLILAYKIVQKKPNELIDLLKYHASRHCKEYYYTIRCQNDLQDPLKIAARIIYLNKTCYNGLYRVNKSGNFNVPIGKYKNPNIVQSKNILSCHEALKNAVIEAKEFDTIRPKENDFVYFDPPYHSTDDISFTTYTSLDFTEKDQIRLRDFALDLCKSGVNVMLSNSNTEFIRELYDVKPFTIKVVNAPRFVNCKSNGRDHVEEVLIRSYQ